MQGMGEGGCPFTFNMAPATFTVGDSVSCRVTGSLEGFPFAGVLLEVHVVPTSDVDDKASRMRATRESRPVVREEDVR